MRGAMRGCLGFLKHNKDVLYESVGVLRSTIEGARSFEDVTRAFRFFLRRSTEMSKGALEGCN